MLFRSEDAAIVAGEKPENAADDAGERRGERKRPALMALLVAILLINVGIWTLPDASGEAPAGRVG